METPTLRRGGGAHEGRDSRRSLKRLPLSSTDRANRVGARSDSSAVLTGRWCPVGPCRRSGEGPVLRTGLQESTSVSGLRGTPVLLCLLRRLPFRRRGPSTTRPGSRSGCFVFLVADGRLRSLRPSPRRGFTRKELRDSRPRAGSSDYKCHRCLSDVFFGVSLFLGPLINALVGFLSMILRQNGS